VTNAENYQPAINSAPIVERFKIIGATIIPRHSVVPGVADTGWNDAKSKIRNQVNAWIRQDSGLDAVLDLTA